MEMPEITISGNTFGVEVVDEETHSGKTYLQIEGLDADITDASGNAPWVSAEAIDGLK